MLKAIIAGILLVILSACSIFSSDTKPNVATTNDKVIFVNAPFLNDKLEVNGIASDRTETGTLRVWGQLKNRTGNNLMIEIRSSFIGDNGRTVEKAGAWTRIFIIPNSISSFELLSSVDNAKDFLLEVRESK